MKKLGFKLGGYYFPKMLFFIVICLNLLACSSDDSEILGNEGEGKYAPENVFNKNFKFYKGNQDMWSFEVYFGEEVELITSSSYFFVDDCDAYYEKTGENTAHFISYYTAYTFISGNPIGVYTECDLQLTFISAHHGSFTGKTYSNPESNGELISGMFVYDSDEELDYFIDEEGKDESENNNEENDDKENENAPKDFSISSPIIENISNNEATIKGTIIGENVIFQDRGICYSTQNTPTISDSKISQNSNVINKTVSNLFTGTTYYVRLYAKVNDKYYYGKETVFTTKGEKVTKLILNEVGETSNLLRSKIELHAILPNEIGYYGLCYGKNPHPKITDNFTEESNRKTNWELSNIECGAEYYVRAYHIEGSKVIYYDDSETKIVPLKDKQIQYQFDFSVGDVYNNGSYTLSITISDFPKATYEIKSIIWRYKDAYYTMYGKNYDRVSKNVEVTGNRVTIEITGSIDFPELSDVFPHLNKKNYYIDGFSITPIDNDKAKTYNITFVDEELN